MFQRIAPTLTLIALGLLPLQSSHADEIKIGFVNTERVFREAPAAIASGKKIETEFGPRSLELKRLANDIESRRSNLFAQGPMLSDAQRQAGEKEINELAMQLRQKQQYFQEDLNARQIEENSSIIEKANAVISRVARANNFDLILQEAVYFSKAIDITDLVIKALAND